MIINYKPFKDLTKFFENVINDPNLYDWNMVGSIMKNYCDSIAAIKSSDPDYEKEEEE